MSKTGHFSSNASTSGKSPALGGLDPFARFLLKISAWVAFAIVLLGLPLLVRRVMFPMQVGQGEAINVEFALNLIRGQALYHDPSHAPYLYTAYPPFYPWLQSLLMKVIQNVWVPGRLLAFTGYLGCGCLIWAWGFKRWNWEAALFLGSVFCLFPTWALWGSMDRGDTLCLLLYFSAFLLLYREELSKEKGLKAGVSALWLLALAGILSALSILVKQNALLLPVVYGIYCGTKGNWRKLGIFSAFCLIPVGLVFGMEQWRSEGTFLKYAFLWLDTGINWENLGYYFVHFVMPQAVLLFLTALYLIVAKEMNGLLKLQVLFSLLALLGLARAMSAENYLLDFLLFGSFAVGEGLAAPFKPRLAKRITRPAHTWISVGLVFLLVLLLASTASLRWPDLPKDNDINMKFNAMEYFKKPGRDLSLDLDLVVMAGKPIWLQPVEYKAMVEKGAWSPEPLLNDIRTKKFSTIELYDIPHQYLLPQEAVEEIEKNYHPFLRNYGRIWLAPNPF